MLLEEWVDPLSPQREREEGRTPRCKILLVVQNSEIWFPILTNYCEWNLMSKDRLRKKIGIRIYFWAVRGVYRSTGSEQVWSDLKYYTRLYIMNNNIMFFHLPKVFVTRIIVNIILLRYINKNMIIQILMSIIYMNLILLYSKTLKIIIIAICTNIA